MEEETSNFATYLQQKKGALIQTIKTFFSVAEKEFKPKEVPSNISDKEKFYKDLSNLMTK